MRIRLLGTGTPTPSLERASSSYLVELGNDVILFDHGPGSHERLLEAGLGATDVTHVFFSHLHYDHCLDYARLVLTRWDQGGDRIPELEVHGPPELARMTRLLFGEDGAFAADIRARIEYPGSVDVFAARGGTPPRARPEPRLTELRTGSIVKGDGWTVTTAGVVHVQPYLDCYAYRLDASEGSLVYSGDCGPSKAMVRLARDCDVLIHMCHYISGTEPSPSYAKACGGHLEVARVAEEAGARTLVVSHVLEQMDVPGVRERILFEMGEIYGGNLIWGEDGMDVPLGAAARAGVR